MARLKGSSLMEATIALALLTVVMGIAWLTFEQLLSNNRTVQEFQAELLMRQRANQLKELPFTASGVWDSLGYRIKHEVEPLLDSDGVLVLRLQCESPDQRLFQFQQLIKYEP